MKKVPKIGQRVRYSSQLGWDKEPRVCTGVVTKIYRTYDYDYDGDDEPIIGTERVRPITEWHVSVKVDRPLPSWWAYGDKQDKFAPCLKDLHECKDRRAA